DSRAVAMDVVENQPFTQRKIAKRQVFSSEATKNRVEEHGAADVQIRPSRIEARHVKPLLDVRGDEPLAQSMYRLDADPLISDVLWRRTFFFRDCERAETENGARRSDDAIEA